MYFLYKEHAHAGSYYISKKAYKKNVKEREGFCEQCYNKMLEIREIKGKVGSAYEGKKLWADYEIPYYDEQLGHDKETQDGINNLRALVPKNLHSGLSVSTSAATKEEVEEEIAKTGKFYLGIIISG